MNPALIAAVMSVVLRRPDHAEAAQATPRRRDREYGPFWADETPADADEPERPDTTVTVEPERPADDPTPKRRRLAAEDRELIVIAVGSLLLLAIAFAVTHAIHYA